MDRSGLTGFGGGGGHSRSIGSGLFPAPSIRGKEGFVCINSGLAVIGCEGGIVGGHRGRVG